MATENIENKIFAGENNISVEQVEEAVISALLLDAGAIVGTFPAVSYTHLDVYKRQNEASPKISPLAHES